jgi:4'-phosphopantetheinyl transferase
MPLRLHSALSDGTQIGVWEVTEGLDFFRDHVELVEEEKAEIAGLNPRKLLEWFSSRYLLHLLSEREGRGPCLKDEFGKPFLKDSAYHISISHSHDLVAVIASPRRCGVDIQYQVAKIYRIANKFVSEGEKSLLPSAANEMNGLHVIWGAKECLFKAYGRRGLDFKKNMAVAGEPVISARGQLEGRVFNDSMNQTYDIHYQILENVVLVHALDKR